MSEKFPIIPEDVHHTQGDALRAVERYFERTQTSPDARNAHQISELLEQARHIIGQEPREKVFSREPRHHKEASLQPPQTINPELDETVESDYETMLGQFEINFSNLVADTTRLAEDREAESNAAPPESNSPFEQIDTQATDILSKGVLLLRRVELLIGRDPFLKETLIELRRDLIQELKLLGKIGSREFADKSAAKKIVGRARDLFDQLGNFLEQL